MCIRDSLKAALRDAGALTTEALDYEGVYANQLRRLGEEARIITHVVNNRLVPLTEAQADSLDRYVTAASASMGLLAEVADLRGSLAEPPPALDHAYATALADEAAAVTGIVRDRLVTTSEQQAAAMGHYADAAGASVGLLRDVAGLRQEAQEAIGLVLSADDVARLADDAQRLTRIVRDRLVATSDDAAVAVGRYADAVGSSVGALRDTLELQQAAFAGYVAPSDAQIGQLASDAARIVRGVETAARLYDTTGLEASLAFGEALGSTVSAFRDTLAFNEGLLFGAAVAPDAATLAQFQGGASDILDTTKALATQAQRIPASGLAALHTATSAMSAQADAMIRLAAVPFADLPRVAGAFGGTNAGSVGAGGGVTVNIYNPPQGVDIQSVITQVKQGITQQIGTRR